MSSRTAKLLILGALLGAGIFACVGGTELNPQPLPPADDQGSKNGEGNFGGDTTAQPTTPGAAPTLGNADGSPGPVDGGPDGDAADAHDTD